MPIFKLIFVFDEINLVYYHFYSLKTSKSFMFAYQSPLDKVDLIF